MKSKALALCSSLILLIACGKEKTMEPETILRPVRYGQVILEGGAETNTFSGTAQSSKQANLSFKVAGTINKLSAKVGDKIRKSQLIAALDPQDYKIQYEQAVAQKKQAETQIIITGSQMITSKSTYDRIELLYENNSVPLSEYEQAKGAYEAAVSQHDAAKAQVAAAVKQMEASGNQVKYARLTAPYTGVITAVHVEENELVASGTPIATLTSEGQPEVNIGVPEIVISKVRSGQEVEIQFSTLANNVFKGIVSEVGFSSEQSSTYPVIVQVQNPSKDIRPGMAATVTFSFGTSAQNDSPLTVAPVKAIAEGAEGKYVFVLDSNEDGSYMVKKQNIKIGALLSRGFEVTEGLKEGDLVATAGLKSLLDGMQVRLLED